MSPHSFPLSTSAEQRDSDAQRLRQQHASSLTRYDFPVSESNRNGEGKSSRWQRRDQRRTSERSRLQKHGAALRTVYRDAILKRMRDKKRK